LAAQKPGISTKDVVSAVAEVIRVCRRAGSGLEFAQKYYRLYSRYIESLAAAQVLARDQVVPADHVRLHFRELRPVEFVGATRKLPLLCAQGPLKFVFVHLVAMWAVQPRRFLFRPFVVEVAFVKSHLRFLAVLLSAIIAYFPNVVSIDTCHAPQEKAGAIPRGEGG
jgi:hypothetical protein